MAFNKSSETAVGEVSFWISESDGPSSGTTAKPSTPT
jgi:hypothetical protein